MQFQASLLFTAISSGNGGLVAYILENAFDMNSEFGGETSEVVAYALAEAIAQGPQGAQAAAFTIVSAAAQGGQKAAIFGQSISILVAKAGCVNIQGALLLADSIASANGKFVERAFIEAMSVDVGVVQCLYPICSGDIVGCCSEAFRSVGRCLCNSADATASCRYRLFWQIPAPIWACGFDQPGCTAPKCMCPSR